MILQKLNSVDLADAVNAAIQQGGELVGGVSAIVEMDPPTRNMIYMQAMLMRG